MCLLHAGGKAQSAQHTVCISSELVEGRNGLK